MRRFVLAFAFLALAGVLHADSYKLKVQSYPSKGQTVKHTDISKSVTNIKVTDNDDKELQTKKQQATTEKVYLETTITPSDKGRPSKFTRKYEKARTTGDEDKTESYEGETIVFEQNKDGKYEAKPAGKKKIPEDDLKKLAAEVNRDTRTANPAAELLPDKEVKVGDSWDIAGKKIKAFLGDNSVNVEKSKGKGKLTKAYKKEGQQWGVLEFTMDIDSKIQNEPTRTELKMTLDVAIDGSSPGGKATATVKLAQDRSGEQCGVKFKVIIRSEIKGTIDRVVVEKKKDR
jgi:hypothetical protein